MKHETFLAKFRLVTAGDVLPKVCRADGGSPAASTAQAPQRELTQAGMDSGVVRKSARDSEASPEELACTRLEGLPLDRAVSLAGEVRLLGIVTW